MMDLLERFPGLVDEPHLVPFIEDDDETLEAARIRYRACQRAARRRLERDGIEVRACIARPGIETTAVVRLTDQEVLRG